MKTRRKRMKVKRLRLRKPEHASTSHIVFVWGWVGCEFIDLLVLVVVVANVFFLNSDGVGLGRFA